MLLLGSLLLVVSGICAERNYFKISNQTTWDDARFHCQVCYKDLTTITPTNAEFLGMNLTFDYWIGLRQNINGSKFWSLWANGDPVLYQNWYPGHPVPKKKPEPQPTCPTPPAVNETKPEVMQCPAFMKLCTCLNSSGDGDDNFILEPTTMFNKTGPNTEPGIMWCPALEKLCACLNSSEGNETSITESTTMFTTSHFVTSPTPTMLVSTSSPTISTDLEPEYIEDSCVALLSFGMWQEKQCNESLPYICYDDRFSGTVQVSNVTKLGGNLSWSDAGIYIAQYRVEINGNSTANVINETSYQIGGLDPGTLYSVQVIPVKCDRELNAQNTSFHTLPEEIRNLSKVYVGTNIISLRWKPSKGTNVSYLVNAQPGNLHTTCFFENCNITNLQPGQMYNFTVKAVVNGNVFGEPDYTNACTKPSKVMSLTSSNNESNSIYAKWDSPDANHLQYSYKIILGNMTYNQTDSQSINLPSLTPGTNYILKVSAIVPICSEEGEAASINAYTTPNPVSNLILTSTNDSINASWDSPIGNYAWFNVTISSTMDKNISFPTDTTTNQTYTFTSLKTAVLYTVSVTTYVKKDLNPSCTVTNFNYTKPNAPGKATVQILNSTEVLLSWEIPANSQGVTSINYTVNYVSDFWNDTGDISLTGNTSVNIGGLRSGSMYKFSVIVLAGGCKSLPSTTEGQTAPNTRTLTLTMLCSSSIQLNCMNNDTMQSILNTMKNRFKEEFKDAIYWNLTLRQRN